VATHLENVEKSGNLRVVGEKTGEIGKVRENVFLHERNLAGQFNLVIFNIFKQDYFPMRV